MGDENDEVHIILEVTVVGGINRSKTCLQNHDPLDVFDWF